MSENQRYRVLKRLASGGMAEVFVAESAGIEGFRKQVAIKRVLPQLSRNNQFIEMFLDEARLCARLAHSNVVSVFDIGVGDNTYFIVMEYVDGADLKQVYEYQKKSGRPMPVEAACFIATKICQGLAYAHDLRDQDGGALDIVHRDVTPANVLITRNGEVKIVDFGLAKASSQLAESDAGVIKGKFGYLAPETVMELPVDRRVDVFAAGIILWEMLSGRRLFLGDTDYQTVKLVRDAQIPSLPNVPPQLEEILRTALARDRDLRYQTARDFGRDLVRFLYKFGRPVSEYEVSDIVQGAAGGPAIKKPTLDIGDLIDQVLLEFKSLTQQEQERQGGGTTGMPPPSSFQPELFRFSGGAPSAPADSDPLSSGLGGLSDELEGPDEPAPQQDKSKVPTAWWRGLISR
jgi:serine/threonine-protein kinase